MSLHTFPSRRTNYGLKISVSILVCSINIIKIDNIADSSLNIGEYYRVNIVSDTSKFNTNGSKYRLIWPIYWLIYQFWTNTYTILSKKSAISVWADMGQYIVNMY